MPEYEFVSVEGGQGPNATKAARSHAIRTALLRKSALIAQTEIEVKLPQTKDPKRVQAGSKGRFRLSASSHIEKTIPDESEGARWTFISKYNHAEAKAKQCQHAKIQVPRLKVNVMDPFNSTPIPNSPAAEALMQFFIKGFTLNFNATSLDNQRPWFPYAMQSPVIMRATLALAAGFWAACLPSLDVRLRREGYLQKGETMRLIREHLSAAPSQTLTKEDTLVLSSVATLGNVEAFHGEFAAADVHLKGLYDIIQSRGGTAAIQHDYILCRCINWVDVQVASGLGRTTLWPPFHTLDQVILTSKVVVQAAAPPLRYLPLPKNDGHEAVSSTQAARTIFMLLRQSIASQEAGALMDADSIRILMSTADNHILGFLFANPDGRGSGLVSSAGDSLDPGGDDTTTALVLAAHVFLYAALRAVPPTSQLLRILCCRLRRFLEGNNGEASVEDAIGRVLAGWQGNPALLVWIAFVGVVGAGCTSLNAGNGAWFSSLFHLAVNQALEESVLKSADDAALEVLLGTFLWKEKYCGVALESLQQDSTP